MQPAVKTRICQRIKQVWLDVIEGPDISYNTDPFQTYNTSFKDPDKILGD